MNTNAAFLHVRSSCFLFCALLCTGYLAACQNAPEPVTDAPSAQKTTATSTPESAPATGAASAPVDKGSKEFWNRAYDRKEYLYGTEPNQFLTEQLGPLDSGTLLLPGEGEGRNAVWAASQGWKVDAFDLSEKAMGKAMRLAQKKKVTINYRVANIVQPELEAQKYDAVALIYLHLPADIWAQGLAHLKTALKPGGLLILEVFGPKHIALDTPFGPKSLDVLYTTEGLRKSLHDFEIIMLEEQQIELDEGYHQGKAGVVRLVARKK